MSTFGIELAVMRYGDLFVTRKKIKNHFKLKISCAIKMEIVTHPYGMGYGPFEYSKVRVKSQENTNSW